MMTPDVYQLHLVQMPKKSVISVIQNTNNEIHLCFSKEIPNYKSYIVNVCTCAFAYNNSFFTLKLKTIDLSLVYTSFFIIRLSKYFVCCVTEILLIIIRSRTCAYHIFTYLFRVVICGLFLCTPWHFILSQRKVLF